MKKFFLILSSIFAFFIASYFGLNFLFANFFENTSLSFYESSKLVVIVFGLTILFSIFLNFFLFFLAHGRLGVFNKKEKTEYRKRIDEELRNAQEKENRLYKMNEDHERVKDLKNWGNTKRLQRRNIFLENLNDFFKKVLVPLLGLLTLTGVSKMIWNDLAVNFVDIERINMLQMLAVNFLLFSIFICIGDLFAEKINRKKENFYKFF